MAEADGWDWGEAGTSGRWMEYTYGGVYGGETKPAYRNRADATLSVVAPLLAAKQHDVDWTNAACDAAGAAVERLEARVAELTRERDQHRDLLHSIWLYVAWEWVTKQLPTEQKELWADAVDCASLALEPDDPIVVDRWWRPAAQEAPHVHEWTRCPNCPAGDDKPCACAGVACCDVERAEDAAAQEAPAPTDGRRTDADDYGQDYEAQAAAMGVPLPDSGADGHG